MEDKDADLETYRSYRSVVENQTFSTALCQQTEKEINRLKDERTAVKGRLEEIYREQSRLEEEKKEIETLADTVKEQIDGLKRMDVQFEILLKKYDQYETDRTSLERLKRRIVNLRRSRQRFPCVWVNSGNRRWDLGHW